MTLNGRTNFMKPKKKRSGKRGADSLHGVLAAISEERILQLSNDMSEGISSGTTKEWRAVAYYFRFKMDELKNRTTSLHSTLAALNLSEQMRTMALQEVSAWLKAANAPHKPCGD